MKIVITGGYGFIGSNVANHLQDTIDDCDIIIVDNMTYAANADNVLKGHAHLNEDIAQMDWATFLDNENPHVVINFAAHTHVDNSIKSQQEFINSNYVGVYWMIEALKTRPNIRFIHMSTDEVYGDMPINSPQTFTEADPLQPNNPYSATKAAAEQMIQAYHHTYDFNCIVLRACNQFGKYQHPEKFIPKIIQNARNLDRIPIYGDGCNMREWGHVGYLAEVFRKLCTHEIPLTTLHTFNVGSGLRLTNLEVVLTILDIMKKPKSLIEFVPDRLGHDRKYALDSRHIANHLRCAPEYMSQYLFRNILEDLCGSG